MHERIAPAIESGKSSVPENGVTDATELNWPMAEFSARREEACLAAVEFPGVIVSETFRHGVAFLPPYKGASSYYPLCV